MVEMEKAMLQKMCRDQDLYVTPSINDKLYLHYKGFRGIKNLDEYTGLKVLWLEGNGLPRIEGLEAQTQLRTLYLQENLIQKIENLEAQLHLDTLNLAQNQISKIENLAHMTELTSLSLKSNQLESASDLEHVLKLPRLAVLDIQSNRITDPMILEVLSNMPMLKVLYLQGNEVVKHIKQYRKALIYRCRKLKYLDDRPVFDDERRRVDAWGQALDASGGDHKVAQEAERKEMDQIRQEKQDRDRLNFLHFEKLMADGRLKRQKEAEEEVRRLHEQNNQSPEDEINHFSGEKIIPVQDCDFLQRQRQERWENVVNRPDAFVKGTPPVLEGNQRETIKVDSQRRELLHQVATVGSGSVVALDAFVDSSFPASSVLPPPGPSTVTIPAPPAPVDATHRDRIKEKATLKVQELKSKKQEEAISRASEPLPSATQLITCSNSVFVDNESVPSAHTNVDELD